MKFISILFLTLFILTPQSSSAQTKTESPAPLSKLNQDRLKMNTEVNRLKKKRNEEIFQIKQQFKIEKKQAISLFDINQEKELKKSSPDARDALKLTLAEKRTAKDIEWDEKKEKILVQINKIKDLYKEKIKVFKTEYNKNHPIDPNTGKRK